MLWPSGRIENHCAISSDLEKIHLPALFLGEEKGDLILTLDKACS